MISVETNGFGGEEINVPTADQYDRLARSFDEHQQRSLMVGGAVHNVADPASMSGSFIAELVNEAIGQIETNCRRGGEESHYIAEVCRGRAAICRAYDDAYRRFEIASDDHREAVRTSPPGTETGTPPRPPQRPRPWADLS